MLDIQPVHGLVLAGVALWCFAAAFVGGLLGLVLGNIRLPVLLLVSSSPGAGSGANIGVSAVAAATAAAVHIRRRNVDWRLVAWMAPPSVVGAVCGGLIAGALPGRLLLVVIGALLLGFGLDLLRPRRPAARVRAEPSRGAAVAIGAAVGLIGGLIGLILSTLRVPAMLRWVGTTPSRTVGTNLPVGFAVGVAGVAGHLPSGVDWGLLGVGAAASVPGALLGARFTGRLDEASLLRAIGAVLIVSAAVALARGAAG
jgi:uncharacterized membrane protein YfcA